MKFVRRHRVGVAAAAAIVVALAIGVAVSLHEARVAQRRFAQVRELANTFLFQFYDQVTPLAGSTAVRASIVDTARKYLDGLSKEAGNDKDLILELAQAYERLGDVQSRTGTRQPRAGGRSAAQLSARPGSLCPLAGEPGIAAGSAPQVAKCIAGLRPARIQRRTVRTPPRRSRAGCWICSGTRDPDAATRMLRARRRAQPGRHPSEARTYRGGAGFDGIRQAGASRSAVVGLRATRICRARSHHTQERLARARVFAGDLDGALSAFQELLRNSEPCDEQAPPEDACRTWRFG